VINSASPSPHGSSDRAVLAEILAAALPGPPWQVSVRPDGEACCQRAYEYFVETVHIADELHVGANRRPIDGRGGPAITAESFAGTLRAAIRFLATPPRWEGEA
jgi:hypothetical protein